MADISLQMPPAIFTQALLSGVPGITPSQVVQVYQAAMASTPDAANMDPTQLAAIASLTAKKMAEGSAEIPTPSLPPVTARATSDVPQSDNGTLVAQLGLAHVPAGVASADPYRGSTQEARNPDNPQASGQSQFDPEALKAAQAAQSKYYQDTYGQRSLSNAIAGAASGSSSGRTVEQNNADWAVKDAQALRETLGLQKALQEQATAGTANATANQGIAKGVQGVAQEAQKTATGAFDLQTKQRMNTAGSNESLLATSMLLKQFSDTKQPLPPDLDPKTLTATQAIAFMTPEVLGAYTKLVTAGKTATEGAGIKQGQDIISNDLGLPPTPSYMPGGSSGLGLRPPTSGLGTPTPTFNIQPGTNPADFRAGLVASTPASVVAAFDKQYPSVKGMPPTSQAAPTRLQEMASGPTPEEYAATKAKLGTAARPNEIAPTRPDFTSIVGSLNEGRVDPSETDPQKIAEADTAKLSDVQLLQKKSLESSDPQEIIRLNKQIADMTGQKYKTPMPLNITGVNGTGGASLGQSGLVAANQSATSADQHLAQAQIAQFSLGGKQAAQTALLLAPTHGGVKATNVVTATSAPAQEFNRVVNKLNQDAQALGLVAGGDTTAGGALIGAGAVMAATAPSGIAKAGGAALSALGGLLGNGQAVSTRSEPKTIAALAIAVPEVAQKKTLLLAQQSAYADAHNGDGIGFVNTPTYSAIVNAKPLVNPTTGEVKVPVTNDQRVALKKQGYVNAQIYLGNE